ncbi:hypothetical protein [Candidatus Electronema sp. PJ]|uniref:hypothetical protein n=1 Tax=Candidatus Electronema sp. PJ TaxID=3401572 RepID=UPI003AA8C2A3
MGDTFNSGGGTQIIAKGKGAIGQVNNNYAPTAELLTLLGQVQQELSRLPLSETDKEQVKDAVKTAQQEARKAKPDAAMIAAKLTAAQKVLAAIPGTVAAALPVGDLLGKALIWCSKAVGM